MTGDKTLFSAYFSKEWGFVSYEDYNKGNIIGVGTIGKGLNTIYLA